MHTFEKLYDKKNDSAFVALHISRYLMAEIYSPAVIRQAHNRFRDIPFYARESVHIEMRELINQAPTLSDAALQRIINAHLIARAIKILVAYAHCQVPLTKSIHIPIQHKDFLSERGHRALNILLKAVARGSFTSDMADLAVRTSHKFLMDLGYYKNLINSGSAEVLTFYVHNKNKSFNNYVPPVIQLTQGCPNYCSHCFADARTKMSYMPYPMWRKIYQSLHSHYQYYQGYRWEFPTPKWKSWLPFVPKKTVFNYVPFARFFHDSDPSSYYDPIIGVDAGDISLLLKDKEEPLYFLTRGVTDSLSKRAIAKTALAYPIDLSFVDTPKENMVHNIRQLNKTIRLIRSVHNNQGIARIFHLILKTGPSVPDSTFTGETVIKTMIMPSGRANQFSPVVLDMEHSSDDYPLTINPNGDIVFPHTKDCVYTQEKLNNIFKKPDSRERE